MAVRPSITYYSSRKMSDEDKRHVLALYEDGWTPEDIAEELGLDETEVMDWCAGNL